MSHLAVIEEHCNNSGDTETPQLGKSNDKKGQCHYPRVGVDLDMPKRKVKVIEINKEIKVTSKAKPLGVFWIVRQNTGVQKGTSHTSHPGHIFPALCVCNQPAPSKSQCACDALVIHSWVSDTECGELILLHCCVDLQVGLCTPSLQHVKKELDWRNWSQEGSSSAFAIHHDPRCSFIFKYSCSLRLVSLVFVSTKQKLVSFVAQLIPLLQYFGVIVETKAKSVVSVQLTTA